MDFFLVNPSSFEKSLGEKDAVAHHILLQGLNFAVTAFMHEKNAEETTKLSREATLRKSNEAMIFATVNALLESMRDVSEVLLRSTSTADLTAQSVSSVVL